MAENVLAANKKIRDEIRTKILVSLKTLGGRSRREGLALVYGREHDYLYVTIGAPTDTLGIPLEDEFDTMVLYDPDTYEVRGFEIPSFLERATQAPTKGWAVFASLIQIHGDNVYIAGEQESQQARRVIEELTFA